MTIPTPGLSCLLWGQYPKEMTQKIRRSICGKMFQQPIDHHRELAMERMPQTEEQLSNHESRAPWNVILPFR